MGLEMGYASTSCHKSDGPGDLFRVDVTLNNLLDPLKSIDRETDILRPAIRNTCGDMGDRNGDQSKSQTYSHHLSSGHHGRSSGECSTQSREH
jgi:hypothetical protein